MGSSKRIIISGSGFPGTNDTWRMLQAALDDIFTAMARLAGNKTILYGIQPSLIIPTDQPANYTSGFVAYQGEILAFESGLPAATVTIVEETISAEYDNGATNGTGVNTILPVSQKRYMKFGTGGTATFPFSDLVRLSTIKQLSQFTLPNDIVQDANYVHTDNNLTTAMINAWDALVSNVQSNWNAPANTAAAILNKPTNLLTVLTKGIVYLGDINTDMVIPITFSAPLSYTGYYQVIPNLVSFGSNYNTDNDVFCMTKDHTVNGFKLLLREISGGTQTLRLYYTVIPL